MAGGGGQCQFELTSLQIIFSLYEIICIIFTDYEQKCEVILTIDLK